MRMTYLIGPTIEPPGRTADTIVSEDVKSKSKKLPSNLINNSFI